MRTQRTGIIYTEQGFRRCTMHAENGRITAFSEAESAFDEKLYIVPGFLDKHIHGAYGFDCMHDSENAVKNMAACLPREGVTRFLPTTMTAPKQDILAALRGISDYVKNQKGEGAFCQGIHLEGPFLSPKKAGAQPFRDILPYSESLLEEFCHAAKNTIRQITFAPEENLSCVADMLSRNIVASVGHTDATCEQISEAERLGATSATHVYNAMSKIDSRLVGAVGGVFLSEMWGELICDGKHVVEAAVRLFYKNMGDKTVLVTDSTAAKGKPNGKYLLGNQEILVSDGIALLPDGTIAGSVLPMNQAVKNLRDFCRIPLEKAILAATIAPAKCLHIDSFCGSLAVGKSCDYTVIDDDLHVYETVVNGKTVYKNT